MCMHVLIHTCIYFLLDNTTVYISICQKYLKTSDSLSALPHEGAGTQEEEDRIRKQFLGLNLSNKVLRHHVKPSEPRPQRADFLFRDRGAFSVCQVWLLPEAQPLVESQTDIQSHFQPWIQPPSMGRLSPSQENSPVQREAESEGPLLSPALLHPWANS